MKKYLKWTGYVLGCLLVILVLVAAGFGLRGHARMTHEYQVDQLLTTVPSDSATIARGEHIVAAHGCRDCHGSRLEGTLFLDIPLFRIVAPNLTGGKGGIGSAYRVEDWDRAIRHGVRPNGKMLLVMPFPLFHGLADDDAQALIAYLRQLPPVDSVIEGTKAKPIGYVMLGFAAEKQFAPELTASPKLAPPVGPTAEYGKYVVSHGCVECHGQDLRGGTPPDPDSPKAPPLMAAGYWTLEQFMTALRTGVVPGGKVLRDFMPWKGATSHMSDVEIAAVHSYIKSLPVGEK